MSGCYGIHLHQVLRTQGVRMSSHDFYQQAVVFNAKNCWGLVTDTEAFASPVRAPRQINS
jgi:hypothetical protein